jgi:Ni,Fe-hydrogenase I cytochrome b subunit
MSHQKLQHLPEHHETPDAWHLHSAAEGVPQAEHGGKTNTVVLAFAFVASLGFVATVILVSILYFQVHLTSLRHERIEDTALSAAFHQYRDGAKDRLSGYAFATEDAARAGQVSIPIDQAEQKVIVRYSGTGNGKN